MIKKIRSLLDGSGKKKQPVPEKHISFFKLSDAVTGDGCPLCRLQQKAQDQFIHSLLLERVTDRSLRARFDQNGGFCASHTEKILIRNDGLGMVILNRTLFEREIDALGQKSGGSVFPIPGEGDCEICNYLAEHDDRQIANFLAYWEEDELKNAVLNSSGLCVPHLRKLINAAPKGLPQWLKNFQVKKYRELQDKCDRYRESENSTHEDRPKLTRNESLIWRDMVKNLYGIK